MKKKNIPNILTISRIFISAVLLFTEPLSQSFFMLYVLCGASDMLDGYLARRLHTTTKLGAHLDSIADTVFTVVFIITLYPLLQLTPPIILWIVLIAALRILSVITAIIKFHCFSMLHTFGNKTTGFCIFLLPFFLLIFPPQPIMILLCIIASISAAEEYLIQLLSDKLDLNRKSLFFK